MIANGTSQLVKPGTRPREFNTQNGKPQRNHNDRRTRGNQHDNAGDQDRGTNYSHYDLACQLVGYSDHTINHDSIPDFLLKPASALLDGMSCLTRPADKVLSGLDILRFNRSLGQMNKSSIHIAFLCGLLVNAAAVAEENSPGPLLIISASTPTVEIAPRQKVREPIMLPELEFSLTANAQCRDDWEATQLSISIADTRSTLPRDALLQAAPFSIDMLVPGNQISPIVIENFCLENTADEASTDDRPLTLRIDSFMSAQGSLRCATKDNERVTYAGLALDVLLVCTEPTMTTDGTEPAPGD